MREGESPHLREGMMEAGGDETMKPVPSPRNRGIQDSKNNNVEDVNVNGIKYSKPVPLPRKLLQRFSSSSDKKKGIHETPKVEISAELLSDDAKRGTINIFKRGRSIDPFEEFEKDFQDPHPLRTVSFASPLQELSDEVKARLSSISSSSSLNQSNSDSSDYYDQPIAKTQSQHPKPTTAVPKKPERRALYTNVAPPISQGHPSKLKEQSVIYESIAPLSASQKPIPAYSTVTKHKSSPVTTVLQNGSAQLSSASSSSSLPSIEADFPLIERPQNSYEMSLARIKDEEAHLRSSSSRTTSLPSFVESAFKGNGSSNRSSEGSASASTRKGPNNNYDDVTLEDGTIVFLDNQLNAKEREPSSNLTTSRNSIVMEFDPLFDSRQKRIRPEETRPSNAVRADHDGKELNVEFPPTPEFDTEGRRGEHGWKGRNDIASFPISKPYQNPNYFPVALTGYTPLNDYHDLHPALSPVDENYEDVAPPLVPQPTEDSQSQAADGEEEEEVSQDDLRGDSSDAGVVGNLKRSEGGGSFLRRLSHKIRLIPIREETSGNRRSSTENLATPRCVARHNIVYSSYLYRPAGIMQKEFSKRWCVLAKGKLTFYNDKSVSLEEISLEKGILISKKNDQKLGSNGIQLKPFEINFLGGKNPLILAGETEKERASWMQKYVEVFLSVFPSYIISSYDRCGCCFIKESVTSEWYPSWLILKDRTLYHAFVSGEEFYELDLRKARSVTLGVKDAEQRCPFVDNSDVLTVDMISKILFMQTDVAKITNSWEKVISKAAKQNGDQFQEMQLTIDDVPVIVDKCIDFLYAHGTLAEGIYRQSGSNTRITQLLADFQKDSWSVQISHKEFSAHDVAGTLKRFFRTLPESLFTTRLYESWIATSRLTDERLKMKTYEELLDALPAINRNILKKLICHLYAVHELHEKNLMPLNNLSPIWGPTLMNVESPLKLNQTQSESDEQYKSACAESEVVKDLIRNYYALFRVDSQAREREKKMQDALENFHLGATKRKCSGDMKLYIYIWEKDESTAINVTLTPQGTAHTIVQQLCRLAQLRNYDNLSLHEVICGKSLERPLHPSEIVIETVLRWSIWDIDERKDNYLILKKNTLYPALIPYAKDPTAVYGDFKFADSKTKSFKKYAFKFGRAMLKYYKDAKAATELGSWKIEDIVWYMGTEPKRSPSPRWAFTFVKRNYPFKRSREEPYFGNVVSCTSEEELHKWIAAMVVGEHPAGLYPSVIV